MKLLLYFCFLFQICFLQKESAFFNTIEEDIQKVKELEKMEAQNNLQMKGNKKNLDDVFIVVEGDEASHMKNFKLIGEQSSDIQGAYNECLDNIQNNEFSSKTIEECLGKDSAYVVNDFDFLVRSMLSVYDSRIRKFMIKNCYKEAGLSTSFADSCDTLEKDILYQLWQEFDFAFLIKEHSSKYLYEYANLKENVFNFIVKYLEKIYSELQELLEEVYSHKDITIVKLKQNIDKKTTMIMNIAKENETNPKPLRFKHEINIVEDVHDDGRFNIDNLPKQTDFQSQDKLFTDHDSPEVEEFKLRYHDELEDQEHENINPEGPIVYIPTKKKVKKNIQFTI